MGGAGKVFAPRSALTRCMALAGKTNRFLPLLRVLDVLDTQHAVAPLWRHILRLFDAKPFRCVNKTLAK
jgi:hypothetical protein